MEHPIVIEETKSELVVSKAYVLQMYLEGAKPILWCSNGLYGWIPIERVRNALQVNKDRQKLKTAIPLDLKFTWADVVEIPVQTGRVIKRYNGGKKNESLL